MPYVTCKLCYEQVRSDGMYPSNIQQHWESEHSGEYELVYNENIKELMNGTYTG